MRRSDLVQYKERKWRIGRTSQIVFGERQHLLRVLDSLEGTHLPSPACSRSAASSRNSSTSAPASSTTSTPPGMKRSASFSAPKPNPKMLEKLAKQAPQEDFYLLRLISEHPRANAKTLSRLSRHPYGAIREMSLVIPTPTPPPSAISAKTKPSPSGI